MIKTEAANAAGFHHGGSLRPGNREGCLVFRLGFKAMGFARERPEPMFLVYAVSCNQKPEPVIFQVSTHYLKWF